MSIQMPNDFDLNKAVAKTEFATLLEEGRKYCWSATQANHWPDSTLILVFDHYPSYFVLDYGAMPTVIAEEIARDKNRALGLNNDQVNEIIVHSMIAANINRK